MTAKWDLNEDGSVIAHPFVQAEAAPVLGMFAIVQIRFALEKPSPQLARLQLGMTSAQLREVAALLERVADRLEQRPEVDPS